MMAAEPDTTEHPLWLGLKRRRPSHRARNHHSLRGFWVGAGTNVTMIRDLNRGIIGLTNGAQSGVPETTHQNSWIAFGSVGPPVPGWSYGLARLRNSQTRPAMWLTRRLPVDSAPAGPAGDVVVTKKNGTLSGALGRDGGYTFAPDPWKGDMLFFVASGLGVFTRTS